MSDYREFDFSQNYTDNSTQETERGTGDYYSYHNTEHFEETGSRKKKKKGGFLKKAAALVLGGVLLGGAGAGGFIGVMKLTGYEAKLDKAITASEETKTQVQSPQAVVIPSAATGENAGSTTGGTPTVADVAEAVMPSIVAITNTQIVEQNDYWSYFFYGQSGSKEQTGAGSGIIIGQNDNELLVLTNYHVIENANSLTVTFFDEENYAAKVKGTAPDNDLAVIAVSLSDITDETMAAIKVAALGDSNALRVGDEVIAIGNALGYGQSLTYGHVSALSRDVTMDNGTMTLLQTDAAINPGNSGGALLNMKGEVIGINSAKYSETSVEGMGFAIPISEAMDIINELMNEVTREEVTEDEAAWLGIQGVDIDQTNAKTYNMPEGVYVYAITENGPAAGSELKEKDIITKIAGKSVSNMDELKKELSYHKGNTTVTLDICRLIDGNYQEMQIEVLLGYKKDYDTTTSNGQTNQESGGRMPGRR